MGCCYCRHLNRGRWLPKESIYHINALELLAAFLALKSFKLKISGKHIKIVIDNTAAVTTINNMGSWHSRNCHAIARQIWEFCITNNIWVTAADIPGSCNIIADRESRHFHAQDTEWKLDSGLLNRASTVLNFKPEIDLFASRLNRQFPTYCSYRPDSGASYVDAFSIFMVWLKILLSPTI